MRMLCYKCNHSWTYKGKNTGGEGYITCPSCYYKIRVDKALIEGPSNQKLLTIIPKKEILPTKLLSELPTTTNEIKPLQIKKKEVIKEAPRLYPGFKIYTDQFGDKVGMRDIKSNLNIRQIPY